MCDDSDFAAVGVSATDLLSFRPVTLDCLGTGTIMADLKHAGRHEVARDRL